MSRGSALLGRATATAVATAMVWAVTATVAGAAPVASDAATYAACGRVFPDPHAFWPAPEPASGESPWAKGSASCRASDFMGWDETIAGLQFLASPEMFEDFVEVYDLSDASGPFADVLDFGSGEGMTAGLPTADLGREQVPLYLVRVTDEEDTTIPIEAREHFAYTLSIHGIERAGIEGGIRAIEDLATWASCEKHGEASAANCAQEQASPDNPHPLLETQSDVSVSAGEALRRSSVWFVLANPDGWRRGDKQRSVQSPGAEPGFDYQRYNGNGVDMNRDWPVQGFTFRPYTPWSEPETRTFGKVLQAIEDDWNGGIDLHGQQIDRAFSFTLIGGAERRYDQDRRMLQFVQGAWQDAEARLAWNPLIKGNDEPEPCTWVSGTAPQQSTDPNCDSSNRIYGVQYGTVWDTIDYTVAGSNDGWMGSPLGLSADAVGNEMSMSHITNCGVGTCYLVDFEQLHVDGNKSLIYGMIHFSLVPEDTSYDFGGRAAYLFNPERVTHTGSPASTADPSTFGLPLQDGFAFQMTHTGATTTSEFDVLGPADGVRTGSMRVELTWSNLGAISLGSLNEIALERYRGQENDPDPSSEDEDDWNEVNTYFNQSFIYLQGGARLDANNALPGRYRVRISGDTAPTPAVFDAQVSFDDAPAWPDPGQAPYDVSNMDFLADLRPFAGADNLVPVPHDQVADDTQALAGFDTVVAIDASMLPGFVSPRAGNDALPSIEGDTTVPGPGAGTRSPATSAFVEFEVTEQQGSLNIEVTSDTVIDPDLYLQVQGPDGTYGDDVTTGESGRTGIESLAYLEPAPGTYRLEIHNWAGSPGPAHYVISFEGSPAITNDSPWTTADRDAIGAALLRFAEGGGNVVLTDDSLRALEWMGLVPEGSVSRHYVYAGNVAFTLDDGTTTTYDDPLAANVDLPGAAEGSGRRHQVSEPVPTGYAILDPSGADLESHPQWAVARGAFEAAGGRAAGLVDGDVTLGEFSVGDGVVRILGSLAPTPTEEFDHPFGLASHGVTYTGYNVFRNLLTWQNPNGAASPPVPASPTPATGGGGAAAAAALVSLAALATWRRRSPLH